MPQGKLKVKTRLPKTVKKKPAKAGRPGTSRKNKPVKVKCNPSNKIQKINKQITKNVNAMLESDIRQLANDGQKINLSKKKNASNSNAAKK